MESMDNHDMEQHNLDFLLTLKATLENEINVLKNAQRFTEAARFDILTEDNSMIYSFYNQSVNESINILAQKQVVMENVKVALSTTCPHCWTTDHFETGGDGGFNEITYCTVCETIKHD